jgi:hypothetical protein
MDAQKVFLVQAIDHVGFGHRPNHERNTNHSKEDSDDEQQEELAFMEN